VNELTDNWHGLYKKHLPTGFTGPKEFGLFKKGRLPLAFEKAFGKTGFTGPKDVVDKPVDEQLDGAESVRDFFQDVRLWGGNHFL